MHAQRRIGMKIDVLIIERHAIVADVISEFVAANPRVNSVAKVGSVKESLKLFLQDSRQWGLILLDLNVSAGSGAEDLSLAREMQFVGKEGTTCVLAHGPQFLEQVRADGFHGYIQKALPTRDFTHALNRVISGEKIFVIV